MLNSRLRKSVSWPIVRESVVRMRRMPVSCQRGPAKTECLKQRASKTYFNWLLSHHRNQHCLLSALNRLCRFIFKGLICKDKTVHAVHYYPYAIAYWNSVKRPISRSRISYPRYGDDHCRKDSLVQTGHPMHESNHCCRARHSRLTGSRRIAKACPVS